jgi:hypothetical protein
MKPEQPEQVDQNTSPYRSERNLILQAMGMLVASVTVWLRHGFGPEFFPRHWNGFFLLFMPLSGTALIGFLFAILAYTRLSSPLLTFFLIGSFFLSIIHRIISGIARARRRRGNFQGPTRIHHLSEYRGTPWLNLILGRVGVPVWFTRGFVEPALCGGLGYYLLQVDGPFGTWLCLSAVAICVQEMFIRGRENEYRVTMEDQRIIAELQSPQVNSPQSSPPSPVKIHRRR